MPSSAPITRLAAACVLLPLPLLIAGCSASDDRESSNLAELREQIVLNVPATRGTWEMFETPESGRVPGPVDYLTLVAELKDVPATWAAGKPERPDEAWVLPNAARPWLSAESKALLQRAVSDKTALRDDGHCRPHSAQVRKSGRVVTGFACTYGNRVLLYLTLSHPEMSRQAVYSPQQHGRLAHH